MSVVPLRPIDGWSAGFVGLPYDDEDRGRAGLHCFALVRLILREACGVEVADYGPARDAQFNAQRMRNGFAAWPWRRVVGPPQPFDVVVFERAGIDDHCGVVVTRREFIHVQEGRCSAVDWLDIGPWARRLSGCYRHEALA